MAKFSIATNFDLNFLSKIKKLNEKYTSSETIEVYGSLPISLTGSGRSSIGLPKVSTHDLANHIEHAHGFGIEFNYLMNSPGNMNLHDSGLKRKIHSFIDYLKEIKVDSITIADESLIKYVRKEFKEIPIHVSLITGVDTPEKAKMFSDLGVKLITLNPHTINRNKKRIKEITDIVDCQIRLYANVSCLQSCQMRDKHYSWLGSQSSKDSIDGNQQIDPFLLWCEKKYLEKPIGFLQSPFIRPEGLGLYEEIGVNSFKLSDRREPTDALEKLLETYMSGESEGNLFALLFRDDRKWTNAIRKIVDTESLGHTEIFIDNYKLTELGFDQKVLRLNKEELNEFYQLATNKVVSGISDSKTKDFHVKLHSVKG